MSLQGTPRSAVRTLTVVPPFRRHPNRSLQRPPSPQGASEELLSGCQAGPSFRKKIKNVPILRTLKHVLLLNPELETPGREAESAESEDVGEERHCDLGEVARWRVMRTGRWCVPTCYMHSRLHRSRT